VTDPEILYCAAAVYLRVTKSSACSSPSPAPPSPFPSPFHTSLFPSTRDRPIYAYEHSIKNSSSETVECSTPSPSLHKHQALSITHHASLLRVIRALVSSGAPAAAFKRPRPQTLPMCAPCKPRLSAAPTAPHHTTPPPPPTVAGPARLTLTLTWPPSTAASESETQDDHGHNPRPRTCQQRLLPAFTISRYHEH
jgi:hypothetical protein